MSTEQSPADSVEDRIAAQFDQPDPPEQEQPAPETEESTEEEAAPEFVEVEVEGELYQVPPKLKDKLMAESDYTKKTQEVAEQRRLVDVRAQQIKASETERAFHAAVKDDILAAQRIDFQIEQYKNVDATGLNSDQLWNLSRTLDKLKDDKEQLNRKIQEKYGAFQQEQQKLTQEMLSKAKEAAAKAIPNWSEATQKQIRDYAVSQGFEANELNGITDPRVVKILWAASQFAKLQSAKITGKVTSAPSVKPGSSNPMPQTVKDKFAFNKAMKSANGSSAKARVIEAELMRRF